MIASASLRKFVVLLLGLCLSTAALGERDGRIYATELRKLHSQAPPFPGGPNFFAAASGLVKKGDVMYLVADDAQVLAYFRSDELLRQIKLLDRPPLPADSKLRGSIKPDFEALTSFEFKGQTWLMALCSGSGQMRNAGVLIPLSADGSPGAAIEFEMTPLYDALRRRFSELNVEGASVLGDRIRLLQRGNSSKDPNALIDLNFQALLEVAIQGQSVTADVLIEIIEVDLGSLSGPRRPVPWTFTDLCALSGGRSVFTAAAEDTDNPYEDGEILGSAIGVLEADGRVSAFRRVQQVIKLEGMAVDAGFLYAVTDADDPSRAAALYKMKMPTEFRLTRTWFLEP